jgi:predicted nucleic-acid-binding protein
VLVALDSNVILRSLLRDDPAQADVANQIIRENQILLVPTVLLEMEWVLRSAYKWPRARINHALSSLVELENILIEQPDQINWALARHADGADFADVLHLVGARMADKFMTFDKPLASQAGPEATIPVEILST